MAVLQLVCPPATQVSAAAFDNSYRDNFSGSNPRPNPFRVGFKALKKPEICTADELHFVLVSNSEWKLALWRYLPSPKANKPRNHPLLLLSGVGTNAIGYDLSPESSFSRFMSGQGFDTWVLEVRGAGLSALEVNIEEGKQPRTVFQRVLHFLQDYGQNSLIASQIKDLGQKLVNIIKEGQQFFEPQFFGIQENFSSPLEDFLTQLDLIEKYDWDFDHFLEDDLPAVIEYIKTQCKPRDGKLLAIGHSMGGILLYALLSRCGFEGKDPGLTSVATLGSSLDYTSSKSSLKLLLPVADPAKALNVPVIPIGTMLSAIHHLASNPPYVLSWLNPQISSLGMMHPKLLKKLVLKNFCTVPAKLLLQLTTAFQGGGLRDRSGTFFYKAHLCKSSVHILALAGDEDLICPPEAVYETVKAIRKHLVSYRVFGEPCGPHYAHYDLVGSHLARKQVYPCIINFLNHHDI